MDPQVTSVPAPSRIQWLIDLVRLEIALWERIDRRLRDAHGLPLAFFEALYFIAGTPGGSMRVGDLARALITGPHDEPRGARSCGSLGRGLCNARSTNDCGLSGPLGPAEGRAHRRLRPPVAASAPAPPSRHRERGRSTHRWWQTAPAGG